MKKTPGSPFQPGNTFGRGRNKATMALQEMLDGNGESITRKCALMAIPDLRKTIRRVDIQIAIPFIQEFEMKTSR